MKRQWRGKKSYYKWCLKVPYVAYTVLLGNIDSYVFETKVLIAFGHDLRQESDLR